MLSSRTARSSPGCARSTATARSPQGRAGTRSRASARSTCRGSRLRYADRLRVCSLLPSATEIVGALGCADLLVGRSAECDHPPGVSALPVVTAARIESGELRSRDIDAAVRDAVLDGRSLYALDDAL